MNRKTQAELAAVLDHDNDRREAALEQAEASIAAGHQLFVATAQAGTAANVAVHEALVGGRIARQPLSALSLDQPFGWPTTHFLH